MLERRALEALGESMARTRTYAELETAMFDQSEIIWRYLSGLDPTARQEFAPDRRRWWTTGRTAGAAELGPGEVALADGVGRHSATRSWPVSDSVFALADAGHRPGGATALAQRELKGRLQPALTADEPGDLSPGPRVERARRLQPGWRRSWPDEGRTLVAIIALSLAAGLLGVLGHLAQPRPARSAS